MGVLMYRDPNTGEYKPLGGGTEEVSISTDAPASPYTDLWVDTDAPAPVVDWSYADNRYLTSGFRNVIRNGDMSIAQRGNSFSAFGYTVDGWLTGGSGGTVTTTRTTTSTTSPPYVAVAVAGQSAVGDYCRFVSRIEDVRTMNGSTVTVSFTAWAASGSPKVGVEFGQLFGTGGSVTAPITVPCGTVTLSTTASRYTLTFAVPSTVGKTLGTNNDHYVDIGFWFSAGSNYSSRVPGLGLQSGTFYITDVQLEAGSAATAFERLPVQQQLAWCQRYFYRIEGSSRPYSTGHNYDSNTGSYTLIHFPKMRTTPTVSFATASLFFRLSAGVAVACTAMIPGYLSPDCIEVIAQSPAAGSIGDGCWTRSNSHAYIDLSAEL